MASPGQQIAPSTTISDQVLTIPPTPRHGTLSLRQWHPSLAASLAKSANNPAVWRQLRDRMPHPYTLADAQWWIRHNQDPANWVEVRTFDARGVETVGPKKSAQFAITAANQLGEEEAIGSIGLEMGIDIARRTAQLGYWLAEPYWGRGIMPDVVARLLEWTWHAFPGLVRVYSEINASNERSAGVLQKSGFVYESRQRAGAWKNGKIGDVLVFVVLRPGLEY